MKKTLYRLALLLASGSFALLAAEAICAWLTPTAGSGGISRDFLGRSFTNPDPGAEPAGERVGENAWDLKADFTGHFRSRRTPSYTVTTNALRLRDADNPASPKPPGQRRILVLGDSQTYGHGLDAAQTFAYLTEHALREAGLPDTEVLNGGVSGYGTHEALLKAKRTLPALQADLVILVFHAHQALTGDEGNDLDNNMRAMRTQPPVGGRPATPPPTAPPPNAAAAPPPEPPTVAGFHRQIWDWLVSHSHLCTSVSSIKQALQGNTLPRRISGQDPADPNLAKVWTQTHAWIDELRSLAEKEGGARLALVYLPTYAAVQNNDDTVLAELAATGLPTLSLLPPLRREAGGNVGRLLFKLDPHYNARANRVIARELSSFVGNLLSPNPTSADR